MGPNRFLVARTRRSVLCWSPSKVEHDVDQVLEQPRAGDRAVLGDVADQHRRDAALLGDPDEGVGDLAHLGDAACGAVDLGWRDGLHRVEDEQARLDGVDLAEDRAEVGLGGEPELGVDGADAVGAQPHLGDRLLAGDVQRADAVRGRRVAATSSSRVDLPTPGSPASSTTPPGTRPPPRTRSSSSTPVGRAVAWSTSTSTIGRAAALTGPAVTPLGAGARPRRRCPRPGTRRSGRPTWPPSSRTRRTGTRPAPLPWVPKPRSPLRQRGWPATSLGKRPPTDGQRLTPNECGVSSSRLGERVVLAKKVRG